MSYLNKYVSGSTPQTEKAKESQVQNNAGGYVFKISNFEQLTRFLILGTSGGTFYASERKITTENIDIIKKCLKEDFIKTIDTIVTISTEGRAPKNDQAIFALAVAASYDNPDCRKYALGKLSQVCRIGTHLFHFMEFVSSMRGTGRGLRSALASWYTSKDPFQLSMQLAKYKQRDGWSHRDVLRLSHPEPQNDITNNLFKYATGKDVNAEDITGLARTDLLIKDKNISEVVNIIKDTVVQREILSTEHLNDPRVWKVLYPSLGYDALLRNLNKLTMVGILDEGNFKDTNTIVDILSNEDKIKKSMIHPISILNSARTYFSGHGMKGSLTWKPNNKLRKPLDEAFYKSFSNLEPTGKNFYLGIDVSGSMSWGNIAGTSIMPSEAAAAMAMVTMRSERNWIVKAFSHEMKDIPIDSSMTIDRVIEKMKAISMGATDCALPMLDAINNSYNNIDCFIIYTDNETWHGKTHPFEALKMYRKKFNKNAKLIVVGMTSTGFSIADPSDGGCIDLVGFDSATPRIISEFVSF